MNVFHCCTHKTASQWVRAIFSDPRVQEFSGLKPYYYEEKALAKYGVQKPSEKVFDEPFPDNTVITPLYADYSSFCRARSMSSSQAFAFFVTRDPRDMLVSWYFSMRYSHQPIVDDVSLVRELLNSKSEKEGLKQSIRLLASFDLFESIHSWINASSEDKDIILIKYEDLTSSNNVNVFMDLFRGFGIDVPENILREVLEEYEFEHLTGRKKGLQDLQAHLRKGIEGDWINFLDDEILEEFQNFAGDLSEKLGYKSKHELTRQNLHFYQQLSSELYSDLHTTETRLISIESELSSMKHELSSANREISLKQAHLEGVKQELLHTQTELVVAKSVIKRKSSTVKRLKSRVSDQAQKLRETARSLKILENRIRQMESSKFWKLKQFWLGVTTRRFGIFL
ncbi:Chromosome partition protein Smc [Leptolyngbya sp. O-77]|nr:Chromosome partition protein Smc [Leptolyngbya sp. O-77]